MVGALPSLRKSSIVANVSVPREDVWQEPIEGDVVVSESTDKRSNIYQVDRQTNKYAKTFGSGVGENIIVWRCKLRNKMKYSIFAKGNTF